MARHDIFVGYWQQSAVNCLSMALGQFGWGRPPHYIANLMGVTFGLQYRRTRREVLLHQGPMSLGDRMDRALEILGVSCEQQVWSKSAPDSSTILGSLIAWTQHGPVIVGPVDSHLLTYRDCRCRTEHAEHYLLVVDADRQMAVVHDPDGFAYATLPIQQLLGACLAHTNPNREIFKMRRIVARSSPPGADLVLATVLREGLDISLDRIEHQPHVTGEGSAGALRQLSQDLAIGPEQAVCRALMNWDGAVYYLAAARFFAEEGAADLADVRSQQARLVGSLRTQAWRSEWQEASATALKVAVLEQQCIELLQRAVQLLEPEAVVAHEETHNR